MITIYFAPPGVGKSTLCARFAFWEWFKKKFSNNKYERVFCNFPVKHTFLYEKDDLGVYDMGSNTLILLDEAGSEYWSRSYKDLARHQMDYFRKHRHYRHDIILFSQSFDCDKLLRDLTPMLYYIKKCWFWPYTVKCLRIHKSMIVDEDSHQLLDGYEFDPFLVRLFTTKRYYLPPYWGLFDSWETPKLSDAKIFKRYD